MLKGLNFKD